MDKLARLNSEDRDNLTAYLDGELDENSTRRIESILTSSSVARNDVEVLARTYELLDLLPRPSVGKDFTDKTIASIKLDSQRKPISRFAWYQYIRRGLPLLGWTAGILVCGCIGFSLTNRWIPQPDDLLLEELPIIQNFDIYSEVNNIEFLEALSSQKQLLEDMQRETQP